MTRPAARTDLEQVPHGRAAQRLTWLFLPSDLRGLVEERLGSPVVHAESRTSGFTPGFASVLTGADGASLFVKAASKKAQSGFARAYLAEAAKLAVMPAGLPAPELLWVHEDERWVALGFEAVDGRPPTRPWRPAELGRALDLAEVIAAVTDPVPADLDLERVVEEIPALVTAWERVDPGWPHRDEAAALAASYAALPDRAFCHTDLRDDNVLLLRDGGALACDWNWPASGPRWQDTIDLLVSAYGDGVDVEPIVAARALTREVDPEHVDGWLAALGGFMIEASDRPVPSASPFLRVHSRWYAAALWGWLCDRRGLVLMGPHVTRDHPMSRALPLGRFGWQRAALISSTFVSGTRTPSSFDSNIQTSRRGVPSGEHQVPDQAQQTERRCARAQQVREVGA